MKYNHLLRNWMETIERKELQAICEAIQADKFLGSSQPTFQLMKAFQFGYAYGKAAERARRRKRGRGTSHTSME